MKFRRLLSLLLALSLPLSLLILPAGAATKYPPVAKTRTYQGQFADVTGTWSEDYVAACYETGLLDGMTADTFAPGGELTYAQITVIAARLHGLIRGGNGALPAAGEGERWFQPAADYLLEHLDTSTEAGDYVYYDLMYLEDYADLTCDRYDFVWYLSAVLPQGYLPAINEITVLPDTGDDDILLFYNGGILTGTDSYGTFDGLDPLTRAQAAAMLARLADPALRLSFTPAQFLFCRDVLGLDPDTVLLTVDGFEVSAELWSYFFYQNLSSLQYELLYSYYEEYDSYFEDYMNDDDYLDGFADYLLEKHGIQVDTQVDWTAVLADGRTAAQRLEEETLEDVVQLAVLLNREKEYPLTGAQKEELEEDLLSYSSIYYGFGSDFLRTIVTSYYVSDNLCASLSLTPGELDSYLREMGYVYGNMALFFYGEYGSYSTAGEAKSAADETRAKLAANLNDPEYLDFLFYKHGDLHLSAPTLFSPDYLTENIAAALMDLRPGQLSQVLAGEDYYFICYKADPTRDEDLSELAASIPAEAQIKAWAEEARTETTAAYGELEFSALAEALRAYFNDSWQD